MFEVGDHVRIVDGPFCDFNAKVAEVFASRQKARVTVSIYGRPETIELDFAQIRRVASN